MTHEPQRTVTTKDFAIGVLGVTAVILLAALLAINASLPGRALAVTPAGAAGDFLVTTARLNEATGLLIIINTQQQLMNGYGFNVQTRQIELIQQIDLERLTKDMQRFQREQRGGPPGQQERMPPGPGFQPKGQPRR
jgi:hypothetical protein